MRIFIHRGQQTFGPYSLSDVKHELGNGSLSPADLASYDGRKEQIPLSTVPGVTDETSPPPVVRRAEAGQPPLRARQRRPAGEWEVLCPHCVDVIGTPDTLFCPNCDGPLQLQGGFATSLKCVRCDTQVGRVKCATCGSSASGSYIRKTVTAAKTLSNPADEASAAVCPACDCAHTNKLRDTGCATVFWFVLSLPFFLIPYFIYCFMAKYRLPNTKCLGCGHEWNAKENR